jgi:RNA polymerase sigma-70 factor, ECF subfamily
MILAIIKSMLKPDSAGAQGKREPVSWRDREDEELMLLYSQGEPQAFEELMRRHERPLFNFILRSTKRADIAEELLQEVFLRVIRSAADYEQKAKFTTWVYTIARNLCIDRARKHKRRQELSLDEKVGGADSDQGQSFGELLVDENEQLPEDQREVFLLKEVSGLKFREIADVVGAPVPTVKSRMRYAIQALRGFMADYRDHSFDEEERLEVVRSGE